MEIKMEDKKSQIQIQREYELVEKLQKIVKNVFKNSDFDRFYGGSKGAGNRTIYYDRSQKENTKKFNRCLEITVENLDLSKPLFNYNIENELIYFGNNIPKDEKPRNYSCFKGTSISDKNLEILLEKYLTNVVLPSVKIFEELEQK